MRALLQLVAALACSTTVVSQCYFPNGGAVGSDTVCNPNALVSACCYDNQACLSNGLCVSDPHDPVKARLHRGTCTDKSWKSGACPRHCLDIDNNGVPVYSCNSTSVDSYCCYDGCSCQASSGSEIFTFAESPADVYTLTIIGESYTQTHTSAASTTSSPTSSTSLSTATTQSVSISTSGSNSASTSGATGGSSASAASASATSSSVSAAEPEKKSNTTALGVGLGVGIPVAALIGVGVFYLLRRRRQRNPDSPPSELAADEYALHPTSPTTKYAQTAEVGVATSPAVPVTHELNGAGDGKPVELPAHASGAAGGAQAVELESPLRSPNQATDRST